MNTWQDIYGHEQIKSDLCDLLKNRKLPHALLFSGAEGIGKQIVAKVLAKSLLCKDVDSLEPCGQCSSCNLFDENNHPDFYYLEPEIKSKRTLKIEQIRQMQTNIALAPYLSDKRVVIINDAQYLNDAAANSLLKTLEEPVGNVFFILITANKDMLLSTILSRCMKIYFPLLDSLVIKQILKDKYDIDDEKSQIIAGLANGSMQKALQFIDDDALLLRDKALEIMTEDFSVRKIWSFLEEYASVEKNKIEDLFMHLQMLLRDLLIIDFNDDVKLIYNQDKIEQLQNISLKDSKTNILIKLSLVEDVLKRLNSNADIKLILQRFILKWQDIK